MKTITKIMLIALVNITFVNAQTTQKWLQLGSGAPKNLTTMPSMVFDRNGNLYLAYTDQSTSQNKATVKKFDGQTWTTIGNQLTPADAWFVDLTLDTAGMPILAFQETISATKKLSVMKYNGTSWSSIGTAGFATPEFSNPEIDIKINPVNNFPIVAFREFPSGKASVMSWNGTVWGYYNNGQNITQGDATKISLSVTNAGHAYITFKNGFRNNKLSMLNNISPTTWMYEGDTIISAGIPDYITSFTNGTWAPLVAYKDLNDDKVYMRANMSGASPTWTTLGSSAVSDGLGNYVTVEERNGIFYCGYLDGTASPHSTVKKFNLQAAGTWTVVGKKGFSDTLGGLASAYYTTLGIDKYDSLYMAFQSFNEYVVMKYRKITTNNTGINEKNKEDNLYLYPNPAHNTVTIKANKNGTFTLKLLTIDGKTLIEKSGSGEKEMEMDISSQPRGIYFLEMKQAEKITRGKLVIQ
jgi:hypothetical protein